MVIYSRKEMDNVNSNVSYELVDPPKDILQIIHENNEMLTKQVQQLEKDNAKLMEDIKNHSENYNTFMSLAPCSFSSNFYLIDAVWFSSWVSGENHNNPVDNRALLCMHDKVNPKKLHRMKMIDEQAWNFLTQVIVQGGGPALTKYHLCLECATQIYNGNYIIY